LDQAKAINANYPDLDCRYGLAYWIAGQRKLGDQWLGRCYAQAQSNRGPKGRKRDFADALRLVKRFLSEDLILSYVPDAEQRLWCRLTRTKTRLGDQRKRLQLPVEALLEEMMVKLSSVGVICLDQAGGAYWRR
jgi:hypothetical protein